jgi:hypothetical protein
MRQWKSSKQSKRTMSEWSEWRRSKEQPEFEMAPINAEISHQGQRSSIADIDLQSSNRRG